RCLVTTCLLREGGRVEERDGGADGHRDEHVRSVPPPPSVDGHDVRIRSHDLWEYRNPAAPVKVARHRPQHHGASEVPARRAGATPEKHSHLAARLRYHPRMSRRTAQREAIMSALADAEGPLTAQEVHERARGRLNGLGLATVYRNLGQLEEGGDVVSVHLPQDAARYELSGRGHHHHFRCVRCGS